MGFKTPTLRNVALTAPYMHDGSIETLAEAGRTFEGGILEVGVAAGKVWVANWARAERGDSMSPHCNAAVVRSNGDAAITELRRNAAGHLLRSA